MMHKVCLLALLFAAACAAPASQDSGSVNYGQAMEMMLQAWKKMTPCGYAPYNIPVYAPLTNEFSSFVYVGEGYNLQGNTSNIYITGLNNFELISGSYNESSSHATFDIMYPDIQVLGSYEMEGFIKFFGFDIPIYQKSLINEQLKDLRFVGDYTFAQSLMSPLGLRISDFNLQFYLSDVKIDNWDTLWSIAKNDAANRWSSDMLSVFAKEIQPSMHALLEKYVLPYVNDMLATVDMSQLTANMVTAANNWNAAGCNVQA